jgi:hypothetical protein
MLQLWRPTRYCQPQIHSLIVALPPLGGQGQPPAQRSKQSPTFPGL